MHRRALLTLLLRGHDPPHGSITATLPPLNERAMLAFIKTKRRMS